MIETLWDKWRRGDMPTQEEIDREARNVRDMEQFAITTLDLTLVRLSELAARPTVDITELDSVVDELRVGRRELAAKISRLKG